MIAARWRFALSGILRRRGRASLVVLAMAAAVFEIGTMLHAYALLRPELTTLYARTRPASATLVVGSLTDGLVDSVARLPGVGAAEARPLILARVRVAGDEWVPAILYVVRDFRRQRLDTLDPDRGAWPPGDGDLLLERSALRVARVAPGATVTVRTADGAEHAVTVAGTAHAAGLPPSWMEHVVTGFVGWGSPLRAGGESGQLRIVVSAHLLDEGHIHEVADSVAAALGRWGHPVTRITVPEPGRHPHADQMAAFLYLLLGFGILSFALSTALVAGLVQALMAEQARQIGVMKAIGATARQVAGIYLAQVAMLATAALAIGTPLGTLAGGAYANFSAGMLNADLSSRPFPIGVVLIEIVAGLAGPILVALVPVLRAARRPVREALGDAPEPAGAAGDARRAGGNGGAWLPRATGFWLRTTFLKRGRLALTVLALALGGAVFMSALNVAGAWTRDVDADFRARRYDLMVGLVRPTPVERVARALRAVPAVAGSEYWAAVSGYLVGAAGVPGRPVTLVGPTRGSRMVAPRMVHGRWLDDPGPAGAVINPAVLALDPALQVGDSVRVKVRSRTVALPIAGVVQELVPMPVVYAPRAVVLQASGESPDTVRSVRLVTRGHDDAAQRAAARDLERAFEQQGIEVNGMQRMSDARQGILDHLLIVMTILILAASIVVFVGALGLATTIALGVVQRTREIGILSAIGATPRRVSFHVWLESMVIGLASWVIANLLAAPISYALESACGRIFFKTPLAFHLSPQASAAWLLLTIVIATAAGALPARRASRLTVREALSAV